MPADIDPGIALRRALDALRAGRPREALTEAQAVLAVAPRHPSALHLAGVALLRGGQGPEAVRTLREAVQAAPTLHPIRSALAMALREQGDFRGAIEALAGAGDAVRTQGTLARELGLALLAAGERRAALSWLRKTAMMDPMDFQIAQRVVDEVARDVRAGVRSASAATTAESSLPLVDVGFCSIDPAREAAARASFERVLGEACRVHVVHDARSLAEGLNRLLERMTAEVVILCHDDIDVLGDGFAGALASALQRADIVGVAGSRLASGPAVLWAGHPHVHGWVTYPREGVHEAAPLSFESGVLEGMQTLDGVFLAMRGSVARTLRFDAQTFDGFHFYDLDFSYRAAMQGLRLAVSTDIRLLHASEGDFGDAWKHYAARFMAKHPSLNSPQGSPHWYGARFATREDVIAFYDTLASLEGATLELPAMEGRP